MTGRPRKPGAMGPFIEGYRAWLTTRGYSPGTVIHLLAMAGALGRWMDTRGIAVGDLNRAVIAEFRSARRASGMRCVPGAHGLDPCWSSWDSRVFWPCRFLLADRSRSWCSVTGGGLSAIVGWPRPRSSVM